MAVGHSIKYSHVDEDIYNAKQIAGWEVVCTCGWRSEATYSDFSTNDRHLIWVLQQRARQHEGSV